MNEPTPTRLLAAEGTHNLRDLGGYALPGGRETRWRRVLRGDGLHRLSPLAATRLVDEGLQLVIDLRGPEELSREPNPFAAHPRVRYENVALFDRLAPIASFGGDAARFDMAARYREAADLCGPAIARVLRLIAEAGEGLVLFHCAAGKDRTGIVAALLLLVAGVDRTLVVEDYARTATVAATLLSELRARALRHGQTEAAVRRFLASDPETMHAFIDHLDGQYGGTIAYLRGIGLGSEEIERLQGFLRTRDVPSDRRAS